MVEPCIFYLTERCNFAANQLVTIMEIITFESKAYKELDNKITAIADYIFNHAEMAKQSGFEPTTLTAYISATSLSKFQIGNETVTIFNR